MCAVRISDEDVESERSVIEEERRLKSGASRRLLEAYWSKVYRAGRREDIDAPANAA